MTPSPTPQQSSAAQAGRPGGAGIVGRETKRTENVFLYSISVT